MTPRQHENPRPSRKKLDAGKARRFDTKRARHGDWRHGPTWRFVKQAAESCCASKRLASVVGGTNRRHGPTTRWGRSSNGSRKKYPKTRLDQDEGAVAGGSARP